jgi:hypothetical protein
LACSVRALSDLAKMQGHYSTSGLAPTLEHIGELLDHAAYAGGWDDLACDDATSIARLRGEICSLRDTAERPHSGEGRLRTIPIRSGGTRRLWVCDGCWTLLEEPKA